MLIERISNTVFVEAKGVESAYELPTEYLLYDIVNGIVDTLHHRREDESGFHRILI